jgi:hypothetical protein
MFILITNLECRFVLSFLRSLIIAVSWDTVEYPSPDKVEHSDSRLTDELPFTSAEKKVQKNVLVAFCMLHTHRADITATSEPNGQKNNSGAFKLFPLIIFQNTIHGDKKYWAKKSMCFMYCTACTKHSFSVINT